MSIISSSAKLTHNVIKNHKIHSFQPNNSRYSYLYSILVKQYKIDREAYSYFDVLQRAVDEAGSIFAPQPVDKAGNIQCLTNPDETVIGYISVSKETTCRMFIPMAELELNRFQDFAFDWNCTWEIIGRFHYGIGVRPEPRNAYYDWRRGYYDGDGPGYYVFAPLYCVDCTFRGGTKTKPDFWPNDHQ